MLGNDTSAVEVTNISAHCFWLLLGDEELPVAFSDFPGFKSATVVQISTADWPSPDRLYWPPLDVDVSVRSLRDPGAFPLVSRPGG